jgi:Collagen triple helix repeat (20 copies)
MSDVRIEREGLRGPRGERGERGHRGHDGSTGPTGSTGPSGSATSTGATGPTGPAGLGSPIIAAARVNGNLGGGFFSNKGFASITRNSAGNYSLPLAGTPPPDNNAIVNVTINTAFSTSVVAAAFVSGGVVQVQLLAEPGGGGIDGNFYVTVTDNR